MSHRLELVDGDVSGAIPRSDGFGSYMFKACSPQVVKVNRLYCSPHLTSWRSRCM